MKESFPSRLDTFFDIVSLIDKMKMKASPKVRTEQ
jgi:hypothetical protein